VTPADLAALESRAPCRVAGPTVVGGLVVATSVLPPVSHRPVALAETLVWELGGKEVACWRYPAADALERHRAVVEEYADGVTP
jgi:hypothetical protein